MPDPGALSTTAALPRRYRLRRGLLALSGRLLQPEAPRPASALAPGADPLLEMPYNDARAHLLEQFEDRYIRALVTRAEGNVSLASRLAQMNRAYLTRLLKRHGIQLRRVADDE